MKRLLLLILLCACMTDYSAQNKAKVALKMTQARQEFLKNNFWGALDLYRQADKANPGSATIAYRIGEVQYNLKHYKIAREYFEKAKQLDRNVDEELPLMLGYTYHRLAELDLAVEAYRDYRLSVTDEKAERVNVKDFIDQCLYAKEMMQAPVDVEINNLTLDVNSRFDDYAPSITADGKMMVFTSRRPSTSNVVDEAGDFKYFEDIYFCEWDEEESTWFSAERFDANVNSETHDAVLSIAPDGKQLFVYKNNTRMAGDIFQSDFNGASWSIPQKLKGRINTSYFESSVSITADGNTMYFISERPTGMRHGDIYRSQRSGTDSWGKPENLGDVINTYGDEKFVFIHPNGNTLFFASDGHLTMGSYDIFRSELKDGKWTTPVNLGYPINTVNEESTFSMTADNKKLLISAEYEDGIGERDIYEIDVSNADILHSLNIDSELLSTHSNVSVFGTILTNDDKPLPFEEVRVLDGKTREHVFTGRTDKDGYYEISLQKGRTYDFFLRAKNGETGQFKVNLKNVEPTENSLQQDYQM